MHFDRSVNERELLDVPEGHRKLESDAVLYQFITAFRSGFSNEASSSSLSHIIDFNDPAPALAFGGGRDGCAGEGGSSRRDRAERSIPKTTQRSGEFGRAAPGWLWLAPGLFRGGWRAGCLFRVLWEDRREPPA
jgi:hypothetical protein